jgi:hypothetical protein
MTRIFFPILWLAILISSLLTAPALGTDIITPYADNISLYKNVDDQGNDRGTTLQIVAVNGIKLITDFTFEFTADFNWKLDLVEKHDYYMELSVVKPVYKTLSVNYQRIYGTFVAGQINQFGVRYTFR